MIKTLEEKLLEFNENLQILPISFEQIVFEERVKLNCFYCSRYGNNWKCPPNIPLLDYPKILSEYSNIAIVSISIDINSNFEKVRSETTNILHKSLLMLEKYMWDNNNSLSASFIGGSCKLCKDGCGIDKCNQQKLARIPLEAIGINVVETLKNIGVNIKFPIDKSLSRYGIILW